MAYRKNPENLFVHLIYWEPKKLEKSVDNGRWGEAIEEKRYMYKCMEHSRPVWPGGDPHNFIFPFKYVVDDQKKITYTNGQNRRRMRAIIDLKKNYTINSSTKKKFATNFIMSRALF